MIVIKGETIVICFRVICEFVNFSIVKHLSPIEFHYNQKSFIPLHKV